MTTSAVKLMEEGKTPQLLKYIPKGESPKVYLDLIKAQVMAPDRNGKARSDDDLMLFLYVAKRTGLDPLTRQIYAIYRWDSRIGAEKMTIQVSIDGMRLAAERTKKYAGQSDAVFDSEDGKYPKRATVTVKKMVNGIVVETPATARWSEYAQYNKEKLSSQWESKPYLMLAKCAEALALRKAFPAELSGVYTEEEIRTDILADIPAPEKPAQIEGAERAAITVTDPTKITQILDNRKEMEGAQSK